MKQINFIPLESSRNTQKQFGLSKKFLLSVIALFFFVLVAYGQTEPFITVWKTDTYGKSSSTQVIIPAYGTFDYTWEEVGNASNSGSGSGRDTTFIEFGTAGTYQISITPSGRNPFHRIAFHNGYNHDSEGDLHKLLEVAQWGDIEWSSFVQAYHGADNLEITATDIPDLSNVTNMDAAFALTKFTTASEMHNWNTENITNMSAMFYGNPFFNQDIGSWDVSNVTDMSQMFTRTPSFNQDIGGWNTESVINMAHLFYENEAFNQDIGAWNVANVTDMNLMFTRAYSFNQDIGGWNTESVINMLGMFYGNEVFNQDISSWNVSKVSNMASIFGYASSFNQDLGNWDLRSLVHIYDEDSGADGMFDNSGMNCENYSTTLKAWANNPNTASSITLGADGMQYSPGLEEYRDILINDLGWTIEGDSEGSCTLSVNSEKEVTFDLYPNPTNDFVNINGLKGAESINLFDISGKLLQNFTVDNQEVRIDMTEFASGVYFLNIKTKDQVQTTKKIVKQ